MKNNNSDRQMSYSKNQPDIIDKIIKDVLKAEELMRSSLLNQYFSGAKIKNPGTFPQCVNDTTL